MFRGNSSFRTPVLCRAERPYIAQRNISGIFSERERGNESMDVNKHDAELLEKLRLSEEAKNKAETRAKEAEEKTEEVKRGFTSKMGSHAFEKVSMEEFLSFRKEMIDRIRELEDDIHELKVMRFKK